MQDGDRPIAPPVSEADLARWGAVKVHMHDARMLLIRDAEGNLRSTDDLAALLWNRFRDGEQSQVLELVLLAGRVDLCARLMPEILSTLACWDRDYDAAFRTIASFGPSNISNVMRNYDGKIVRQEDLPNPNEDYENIYLSLSDIHPLIAKAFLEKLLMSSDPFESAKAGELVKKFASLDSE